jgi:hypothetical protein
MRLVYDLTANDTRLGVLLFHLSKDYVFGDFLNVEVAVLVPEVFSERVQELFAWFVDQSRFPGPSNGRA